MGTIVTPSADFAKALSAAPDVKNSWNELTPISQRDFISWINEAKQEVTRAKRISKACDMLAKGKKRPCCYSVVPLKLYSALKEVSATAAWKLLTANEKRDFCDYVNNAKTSQEFLKLAETAAKKVAAGKKSP